ncbi:MAG: hypothetical protein RLZ83_2010 [Pseudomonadota bacterium]|jgi:hypothetical protein
MDLRPIPPIDARTLMQMGLIGVCLPQIDKAPEGERRAW